MKCIAYISKALNCDRNISIPTGLSDIVRISRYKNPKSQITGIISYREGQYLQVLEGPYLEVDNLMSKIASDPRHKDIWVFLDVRIAKRSFPSWGVSVFDFVDQGPLFDVFVESNSAVLNSFDESQQRRIQPFIDIKKSDTAPEKYYEGKNLRLLAWPDLNNESNPQMTMNLCIKLTKKPYSFNALADSGEFGSHHQVTQIIREFDRLGLLSVTEAAPIHEQTVNEKKPNKFYGAIKKFLGMR
ncbi:BLUF domain-containing protein [Psychrobacter immobilis]|uniref:BLUF domain-containing protein n=1 Tax=Psychrobacter immobilis TaxID=498 RepID=UPI003FD5FE7B